MKNKITAPVLAEMIILSTFIANCIHCTPEQRYSKKKAKTATLDARRAILKKIHPEDYSEMMIYEKCNTFFEKNYERFEKSEIIYICRAFLKSYLNNYAFGDSFYNLFKKLHKNSEVFEKKGFDIPETEKINFIKELKSLTQESIIEKK